MRFFLVARDRSTGDVRLVSDGTYPTRDEALAAMGASGNLRDPDASDLFVVDLDAVTPVVMYQAPAATPLAPEPMDEPIADVWEAPDEAKTTPPLEEPWKTVDALAVVEPEAPEEVAPARDDPGPSVLEPVLGEPIVGSAPQIETRDSLSELSVAPEESADDLADALRRAASQMEGDGIVAPPSVEEYAGGTLEPAADDPAPEVPTPEPPLPVGEASAWPWEARDPASETNATVTELGSPETQVAQDPPAETPDAVPVYVPVGIEEPGLEEISLLTPAEPAPFEESPDPGTLESDQAPAKAYEPGELDISAYTCDDCVYVETCPKNHQEGPASCGSFQWKPV